MGNTATLSDGTQVTVTDVAIEIPQPDLILTKDALASRVIFLQYQIDQGAQAQTELDKVNEMLALIPVQVIQPLPPQPAPLQ